LLQLLSKAFNTKPISCQELFVFVFDDVANSPFYQGLCSIAGQKPGGALFTHHTKGG
jgi:hypothetical protein